MKSKIYFTKGEYSFHTPLIGTTDLPPSELRSRIEWSNTPERLKTFFFGDEVLLLKAIKDKKIENIEPIYKNYNLFIKNKYEKDTFLISLKKPTSGYAEISLLGVCGKVGQLKGMCKDNDLVYDYPLYVQENYWGILMKVISNYFRIKKSDNLPSVFRNLSPVVMGHHGRALSKYPHEKQPGIRSVILHHDHLLFINNNNIIPNNWDETILNLDKEAELFWNKKTNHILNLVNNINKDTRVKNYKYPFVPRRIRPMGYETVVNYDTKSIKILSEFLYFHFLAYQKYVTDNGLYVKSELVQPAFICYFFPSNDKKATLIISPSILSGTNRIVAGGPEKAGVLIHRKPDIQPIITEKDKELFWNMLIKQ